MSLGIDYTALYADAGSGGDAITALIGTLVTGGTTGGGDPIAALQSAERNQARDVATTARAPQVQRTIAAFQKAVAAAKTPADLLADPNALTVLLTVNGLGSQAGYPALARQALLSDPGDPKGLANQLVATNANWLAAARTYQFAQKGLAVVQDPGTLATIAQSYAEVVWRQSLDSSTPGLSNALDFRARAGGITSALQVLGDATFRTVVTTALGIPQQIAFQTLEAQQQAISTHLDIGRLQDPHYVDALTQRYLLAAQSGSSGGDVSGIDALAARAGGLVV